MLREETVTKDINSMTYDCIAVDGDGVSAGARVNPTRLSQNSDGLQNAESGTSFFVPTNLFGTIFVLSVTTGLIVGANYTSLSVGVVTSISAALALFFRAQQC